MKAIVPVATPVLVELIDGQPTTTSLDVAAHFGKLHKTVLRAIANLECSPEFTQRNFVPSEYTDTTGRKLTQYRMTRDGFTFLCMGFTGKEAAKWKEAYISAFNQMEAALQQGSTAKEKRAPKALPNGLSTDQQDAIKALVKARVEALPKESQAKAAVTCWSALKSKFGCSYKKIEPDQFADAVGLVARIELEGEWLPKAKEDEFVLGFYEAQEVCHLLHHAIWCVYRWDSSMAAGVKAMNYEVWLNAFEHFQETSRSARRIERLMPEMIGYFRQKNGGLLPEQCAAKGIAV